MVVGRKYILFWKTFLASLIIHKRRKQHKLTPLPFLINFMKIEEKENFPYTSFIEWQARKKNEYLVLNK